MPVLTVCYCSKLRQALAREVDLFCLEKVWILFQFTSLERTVKEPGIQCLRLTNCSQNILECREFCHNSKVT